jgi:hypothetical protein
MKAGDQEATAGLERAKAGKLKRPPPPPTVPGFSTTGATRQAEQAEQAEQEHESTADQPPTGLAEPDSSADGGPTPISYAATDGQLGSNRHDTEGDLPASGYQPPEDLAETGAATAFQGNPDAPAFSYIADPSSGVQELYENQAQQPAQYGGAPDGFGYHPLSQSQVIEQQMSTSQVLEGTGNYAAAGYGHDAATPQPQEPHDAEIEVAEVDDAELIEEDTGNTGKGFRPPR